MEHYRSKKLVHSRKMTIHLHSATALYMSLFAFYSIVKKRKPVIDKNYWLRARHLTAMKINAFLSMTLIFGQ